MNSFWKVMVSALLVVTNTTSIGSSSICFADEITETTNSPLAQSQPRIVTIAAGGSHSLALKSDGTVWTWGRNDEGQLGYRSTMPISRPTQIPDLSGIIAIAGGSHHSLSLDDKGMVWAWGDNSAGELGDGTRVRRYQPVQVQNLTGAVAITANQGGMYPGFSAALRNDGTVWVWGHMHVAGKTGVSIDPTTPVHVPGLTHVIALAAGTNHALALTDDGTVWGWGFSGNGCLGIRDDKWVTAPVKFTGLPQITAISAGQETSFAVAKDGIVWSWGYAGYGCLGDGSYRWQDSRYIPRRVKDLSDVVSVSAGTGFCLARKKDGTVWAWGTNGGGQVGDATVTRRLTPVRLRALSKVRTTAAGSEHALVLKQDGTVWAWGANGDGQLGDRTSQNRNQAIAVKDAN